MTIEERIKAMIISKYGSMREFSKQIGMSQSTLSTIMTRGIHNASISNVLKICKALRISSDELAHDRIVPVEKHPHLTDIDSIILITKNNIQDLKDLTIDGQIMTDNEIETLIDALDIGVGIIKRKRERGRK